jgi:cobyrinic acid a,c-diamide synthase
MSPKAFAIAGRVSGVGKTTVTIGPSGRAQKKRLGQLVLGRRRLGR